MKKLVAFLAVLITLCVLATVTPAYAGSASANLTVGVTVDASCSISTNAVLFPDYAPIGANLTSPDDNTSGSVVITCTVGANTTIGLGGGGHSDGGQSRLFNSTSSTYLPYTLYQDAARTVLWKDAAPDVLTPPSAPNTTPRVFPVYGRIPAAMSGSGQYSDIVVATVNF